MSRPELIQTMILKYHDRWYKMKEGAPYNMSREDTIVELISYRETGEVTVAVWHWNKTTDTLEWEKENYEDTLINGCDCKDSECIAHKIADGSVSLEQVHDMDIKVIIDPIWLEPVSEIISEQQEATYNEHYGKGL